MRKDRLPDRYYHLNIEQILDIDIELEIGVLDAAAHEQNIEYVCVKILL